VHPATSTSTEPMIALIRVIALVSTHHFSLRRASIPPQSLSRPRDALPTDRILSECELRWLRLTKCVEVCHVDDGHTDGVR
jgi:hypothetical protein